MTMNGKQNGRGNGAGAKKQDWFDEVIESIEVMRPIVLTNSIPTVVDPKRPEQSRILRRVTRVAGVNQT
jgi:hypothetical protein